MWLGGREVDMEMMCSGLWLMLLRVTSLISSPKLPPANLKGRKGRAVTVSSGGGSLRGGQGLRFAVTVPRGVMVETPGEWEVIMGWMISTLVETTATTHLMSQRMTNSQMKTWSTTRTIQLP